MVSNTEEFVRKSVIEASGEVWSAGAEVAGSTIDNVQKLLFPGCNSNLATVCAHLRPRSWYPIQIH